MIHAAKVRNASKVGSQIFKLQVGLELNSTGQYHRGYNTGTTAGYDGDRRGIRNPSRVSMDRPWSRTCAPGKVRKTHRYAYVFPQKRDHCLHVFVQIESGEHVLRISIAFNAGAPRFAKQMVGFGQHRLAGIPRRRILRRLLHRPFMVGVAAAQYRHERTSINWHGSCHSPWFSSSSSFSRSCRPANPPPSRSGQR